MEEDVGDIARVEWFCFRFNRMVDVSSIEARRRFSCDKTGLKFGFRW